MFMIVNDPENQRTSTYNYHSRVIANNYLQEKENLAGTINKLGRRGIYGHYLAGEILLEKASQSKGLERNYQLKKAYSSLYESTNPDETILYESDYVTSTKARLRKHQLPAFHHMLARYQLPNNSNLAAIYSNLVANSNELLEYSNRNPRSQDSTSIEARGVLGEMTILLLLQRFALNNMPEGTWTPLQSYFSEDHGGNCIANTDVPSWDINIFTQLEKKAKINKTYSLQIKANMNDYCMAGNKEADTIYILEDLRLNPNEHRIGGAIIKACQIELEEASDSERITNILEERTERLMDKLDTF